jgi:catechol 2,3-dioxygenase-like lactoylglutathione lyase family enzyme
MHIHHIALWTADLERLRNFYSKFFHCRVSNRYNNPKKQFSSYFLSFPKGASIEIMQQADITEPLNHERIGLAHFSISVGSKEQVDAFTKMLEDEGVRIHSYPRTTGDGYYESVILDPDGNKIELTTDS